MPKKNDSWGIEIGANAIKAMRLVRNGSQVELAEYDILPFKQILTTPDLNVEEAIQVNLDTFLSKHDVSKSTVVVSVPGYSAFARFVNLPPVEPKKIPDIVRFEAVQQIPFPMDQVEWDYQTIQSEDAPDVEVGIFAITKERIASHLSNYRRVDMRVDGVTLSPLAVYNAFAFEHQDDTEPEGTIYLDIGTSCTDVIISENDSIWMRTLPIGGNNFTEALVRSFKLSYPKAERLKREAGTSKYARQIFQALRPVFAEMVQEIQRSLGYYQSLHREARLTKLVGVGSTFRLPGLQKFLKQQLQLEVSRPDGFEQIVVEDRRQAALAEQAMNMFTAYGLALQGLDLERISANLLPRQIQMQRMWKAKEPWIAGAAACVVMASGIAGGVLVSEQANWRSAQAEHDHEIEQIVRQAQDYERQWQQDQDEVDPQGHIEILRGMVDYRNLWPRLVEDVTEAVMAVNPQEPLVGADHEAMAQIERTQWRRLFIESVEVDYIPRERGEGGPSFEPGGMVRADAFWPDSAEGRSVAEYAEAMAERANGWRPPRFEIVLTGTTPYAEAAELLARRVVSWLEDSTVRDDRPYRIVVDSEEVLAPVERVGEEATRERQTDRRTRGTRGRDRGARQRGTTMPALPDDEADEEVRELGFDELFPQRPEHLRAQAEDWSFELRWTVELYPPELARRTTEHPAPADAPADADEVARDAGEVDDEPGDATGDDAGPAELGRGTDGQEDAS